jgi:hypothetical protein
MIITATQVLEMLTKAGKLGIHYDVYTDDEEHEHCIQFSVCWYADEFNSYSLEKVFITKEDESCYEPQGWEFSTFMMMLDEKLGEQEQKNIKAEKRKELIAKLTNEEKELLGVK